VDVVDDDVDVAVVVEVGERRTTTGFGNRYRRSELLRDIGEASVLEVPVDDFALLVARFGLEAINFRIDMSVDEKEIEPAVVVEIDKADAPAEPPRVEADAAGKRTILTGALAGVGVERRGVAGEVRLEDVERAVAIVVADRDAHSRLRLSILAVGAAGGNADVGERAIAVVVVQRAWIGIVCHVQVEPAVVIKVDGGNAEPVGTARGGDSRCV
jgi:hypothetical protein